MRRIVFIVAFFLGLHAARGAESGE
ncbi:MAG: hypothetical protein QOE14_2822, partial [Humisphaera sp.]|nr:hypothetical protein [Humisphaera sp.]